MSEWTSTATGLELKSNLGTTFLPGRHRADNLSCHKVCSIQEGKIWEMDIWVIRDMVRYYIVWYRLVRFLIFSAVLVSFIIPNTRLFDKNEHASIFWCVGEKMKFIIWRWYWDTGGEIIGRDHCKRLCALEHYG